MAFKVLYGPPCSGKSTYAREHMGDKDIVYDYDRVSSALTYDDEHTVNDRSYAHKFVMGCRKAIIAIVREGDHEAENVWLLMTNLDDSFREWLKDCDPQYIRMDVTEEECLERLEKDDTRPDKKKWAEVIKKWFEEHQEEESRMINPEREYRSIELRAKEDEQEKCIVEGYATTFDDPYVLYDDGKTKINEVIARDALADADMSDVLFLYNHKGSVFARQKNGTLELKCDEHGIFVRADLSKTEKARQMYEDIKAGMVDQMSWTFTVGADEYDKKTHTRTITKIRKVYDVSAVSIPANPNTELSARAYADGVISAQKAERLEREKRERQIQKIKILSEVTK